MAEELNETEVPTNKKAQLKNAKDLDLAWQFEGSEYGMFVANRTGNITTAILHPTTGKKLALIGAEFAWEDGQPFLDHLNLNIRDERTTREDETTRKRVNLTSQNAKLFRDLLQRGSIQKFDALEEPLDVVQKDRESMLALSPEVQSQIIDDWLGNFHIERYFPPGTDDVDAMLTGVDSVFFTAKIGDFKHPAHVLLFEFAAPSPDARRSYENDTFIAGSKQEGERMISTYNVNNKTKLAFARKYFRSVQGAVLSTTKDVEINTESLYPFVESDSDAVKTFKADFNPNWFVRLADSLADSFNLGGK